ncbi:FAD/NAD(P)-binding protein [Paraconexibacter sp.]|uniref:FAD/NAD(P)-binding protein n=1 Tax=Paraconexibacter sp. TaxID=2949640 RepID=UPI003565BB10
MDLLRAPDEAGPYAPRVHRVADRRQETDDTWTITLDHDGAGFAPGQFSMLYAFGVGEAPISVASVQEGLAHTIRAVGPVTRALCAAPAIGVRGPLGTGWPLDAARGGDLVIVAGGVGLAPVRALVEHALDRRDDHGRIVLLYGARTPADLLYRAELDAWARQGAEILVTVDAASGTWRGRVGVVPGLVPTAGLDGPATTAMVVGPEIMMRFATDALRDAGVPAGRIFVSLERSMKCGIGLCGHCQLGPLLLCRDGPVVPQPVAAPLLKVREL